MVLDSKDVGVSLGTLAPAAMDVVLDGAADAGFGSIAIWQPHIDAARASGMSLQELRAALDQRGLSVVCWESMFSWLGDDATAKANETALALVQLYLHLDYLMTPHLHAANRVALRVLKGGRW